MAHPILTTDDILLKLNEKQNPFWNQYYAFFSSWYGGIIKDPRMMMLLPVDDHLVHRGDGVFEALKSVDRKLYLLEPHLNRLQASAERIGLKLPMSPKEIAQTIIQTLKVADVKETLVRVFVSRGPGAFSANPYDSVGSQLYIIITKLSPPAFEKYLNGVKIGKTDVPVKEGWFPQIKSCNYLPNVLMKKEAVDRGLEFAVSFDSKGFLAESSTENIAIVDQDNILTHPPLDKILKGTTMIRMFELAKNNNMKTAVRPISEKDLLNAKEVMMMGTTLDVLPVTTYEGQEIADGKVGPIAKALLTLIEEDLKTGINY